MAMISATDSSSKRQMLVAGDQRQITAATGYQPPRFYLNSVRFRPTSAASKIAWLLI